MHPLTNVMATLALCVALAVPLQACGSSGGGGGTPPAAPQNTFTISLDTAQEIPAPILGTPVCVTVQNLAPTLGTFQTPFWVGFHDGGFDTYDSGSPASLRFPMTNALERIAEDGDVGPLMQAFTDQGFGTIQGTIGGVLGPAAGPIAPGETTSRVFRLDPDDPSQRYFSYASMVIPSNDAFFANANPLAHPIFDALGNFVATDILIDNTRARDAGTEVNDELPANTAFFGQAAPNTGVSESNNVGVHPGFLMAGSGGILDDAMFSAAALSGGYDFARISFKEQGAPIAPTGQATLAVSGDQTQMDVAITAVNLSGPAVAMHFHRAAAGATGPVEIDLGSLIQQNEGGILTATGSVPVTADFLAALRAGEIYLNIHTALNAPGEIRGQALPANAFAASLDMAQEIPAPTLGTNVRVTVRNQAPSMGTFMTPVWVGFHSGGFDTYDSGSPASLRFPMTNALERLAEDGSVGPITTAFTDQGFGRQQATIGGVLGPVPGPIPPGETASHVIALNPSDPAQRYFSYASMIIPSNDAFVSNANPLAHAIFDGAGNFVASDFIVTNASARDAGTEVNDELPANTAFFGQAAPDTGVSESNNVGVHPGFLAAGMGGILDDAMFANADFTAGGYEFLSFTFQQAPAGVAPTGLATFTLSPDQTQLTFQITAVNVTGPVVAMHLHTGAAGATGPVEIDLGSFITQNEAGVMTAQGTVGITPSQVSSLLSNGLYLNVHTALNAPGEIRGQVLAD